jgi:hypothetical protein
MIDPKPDLSRTALLANIDYCQAKQEQYLKLLKQFEQKEQEYVKMLADLTAVI